MTRRTASTWSITVYGELRTTLFSAGHGGRRALGAASVAGGTVLRHDVGLDQAPPTPRRRLAATFESADGGAVCRHRRRYSTDAEILKFAERVVTADSGVTSKVSRLSRHYWT